MAKELKVLIVDDSEDDALLIVRQIKRDGYKVISERVETPETMKEALERVDWDVVLADYSMPYLNGPVALALVQEMDTDIPCIVVSGTMGEDTAVTMMRTGANDYLMKDNLIRLTPAIEREIADAAVRRQHKQAEEALLESELRFRDFFANAPIGFHIFGSNQILTDINDSELDMIGYSRDEIVGKKTWADLIIPAQIEQFKKHWNDIITKRNVRDLEYTLVHKQGCHINVLLNSSPRFDGNGNFINTRGSVLNITKRKQAEEQLEIAKEHAEAANIAKSQFLANMSHEIRTPISAITGFSDMLVTEELTQEQLTYAELIRNASKSLLTIINDILDYSKIEAGKLDVTPADFSLKKVLDDIADIMQPLAVEKNLPFKIICSETLPAIIQTDEGRLHQCLVNLVSNAIKFTKQGHVHLKVFMENKDNKPFIRFDVEDTGIGIPPDMREHVFESFGQVEKGGTRKYGGTGLGLTITNQLAHLLGGEVSFTSVDEIGSTFSLVIPAGVDVVSELLLKKEKTVRKIIPIKEEVHSYSGNVLVAEDDKGCQILISKLLKRLGLEVTTANDGEEAIEKTLENSFDLIFMDVMMPHLNGFEATEALHQKGITIPIIALTAHAMEGDRELCIQAGCEGYLSKPIEYEKLLGIIEKYLSVKAV